MYVGAILKSIKFSTHTRQIVALLVWNNNEEFLKGFSADKVQRNFDLNY